MREGYTIHKDITIRKDVDNYIAIDTYNRRQMWKILTIVFCIQVFVLLLIVLTAIILVNC